MEFFKRATALPEKFYLEVFVHTVEVHLPFEGFLQVVVKRNQKKKEKTAKYPYNPDTPKTDFETKLTFPVTLYKSKASYAEKKYFFRLVQITKKKSIKNGKAAFDISNLVQNPQSLFTLPLKNCTDTKAIIILTLDLSKIVKTESLSYKIEKIEPPKPERDSKSFDSPINIYSIQEKKKRDREKYVRRIEKVNSFHGSPMSARLIPDSDVSSCASPTSPYKSPDSPEKIDSAPSGFAIRPIKIEFGQEIGESEREWRGFIDRKEKVDEEVFEESEVSVENCDRKVKGDMEEKDESGEEEGKTKITEEDLPKAAYQEVTPGCKSRPEVATIEISSNNTETQCCKCDII